MEKQSFKFFGDKDGATSRVAYKWIKHALRHKVKELVLDLHNTAFSGIPLSVFSNKALEFLCLIARYSGCINLSLPVPDAALYRLRVLHVMRFDLRSVEFDKMLTGCPVLEELLLEDCRLKKPRISMPKLKCLKFIHCVLCDGVVIASNPNLQKLVIYYDFSFSLGNFAVIIDKLPSLVDAVLCLDRCDRISFEGDGLLNVKWLQILLPEVKESLKSIINWISSSRLHNLKYAELLTPLNKKYIKAVKQAIACMPNLENLEIRENLPIVRARSGLEPEKVVSEHFALPKHLHSVKIIPLEPLEVFMDFLSNSVHLKRTDKEELEKYVPL
ncbi:hypothetical protein HPP92_018207 [Vanilla planifolia]|uniref:F-box/LRR-repeat protein 15/At3g58940/PEG3-like LRR domain-containing protein n=1 Tax=Vanilla planifolia TaxID=51239 RepID=A0A835UM18_VANPL|nr:hypothetical protein HPP92_018207 [Vanilla planifolia]